VSIYRELRKLCRELYKIMASSYNYQSYLYRSYIYWSVSKPYLTNNTNILFNIIFGHYLIRSTVYSEKQYTADLNLLIQAISRIGD